MLELHMIARAFPSDHPPFALQSGDHIPSCVRMVPSWHDRGLVANGMCIGVYIFQGDLFSRDLYGVLARPKGDLLWARRRLPYRAVPRRRALGISRTDGCICGARCNGLSLPAVEAL